MQARSLKFPREPPLVSSRVEFFTYNFYKQHVITGAHCPPTSVKALKTEFK